jgi:hypothetical protein
LRRRGEEGREEREERWKRKGERNKEEVRIQVRKTTDEIPL